MTVRRRAPASILAALASPGAAGETARMIAAGTAAACLAGCHPPPPVAPPPDPAVQILRLQTASRPAPPARPLADAEAKAMWQAYVARIGHLPAGNGSGGTDNAAGGGGQPGGGGQ